MLPLQQLSVPVVSQARSTAKVGSTAGSDPLPVTLFDTMWFPSANMSMSDGGGLQASGGLPVQKFATAIPNELLSCSAIGMLASQPLRLNGRFLASHAENSPSIDPAGRPPCPSGDRIFIGPGVYRERGTRCPVEPGHRCAVAVKKDDISLIGRPKNNARVVIENRGSQDVGTHAWAPREVSAGVWQVVKVKQLPHDLR